MSDRRLSIIELNQHAEVLGNFCRYAVGSGIDIYVFTTERIWQQVGLTAQDLPESFHLFIKPGNQDIQAFILAHKSIIDSTGLILINTLSRSYRFYSRTRFRPPVVLRVHNLNTFFFPARAWQPASSWQGLIKDCSYLLRKVLLQGEWYFRRRCLDNARYYLFPTPEISAYALSQGVDARKVLNVDLPMVSYCPAQRAKLDSNDDTVRIAVVGGVLEKRRDYRMVWRAIQQALPRVERRIELVLLGRLRGEYGQALKRDFAALESDRFSCICYDHFIEQSEFDNQLANISFLIMPLAETTRYKIYTERYGYTKMSGNVCDIIKNGIPGLIPAFYPLPSNLREFTKPYTDDHSLAAAIVEWTNSRAFLELDRERCLAPWLLESCQAQLQQFYDQVTGDSGFSVIKASDSKGS